MKLFTCIDSDGVKRVVNLATLTDIAFTELVITLYLSSGRSIEIDPSRENHKDRLLDDLETLELTSRETVLIKMGGPDGINGDLDLSGDPEPLVTPKPAPNRKKRV